MIYIYQLEKDTCLPRQELSQIPENSMEKACQISASTLDLVSSTLFLRAMLYSSCQVTPIWNNNHFRLIASHLFDIMYSLFRCAA